MTRKTEWADFFNDYAPQYEDHDFTKNTTAEVDFLVKELGISPGQSVLDVGCGTGRHSIELARRGYLMTGVDVSAGMLEEARKHAATAGVEVRWIESDATMLSLRQKFDAAICLCEGAFGLLGSRHDPIGQPLAIIRNVAQALKTQSKCLFTVLNACTMIRKHTQEAIEQGAFDPVAMTERAELPPGFEPKTPLRERGFVATEMALLFALCGLEPLAIWGGTAGNWGRRAIDLDEIEIMIVGRRSAAPVEPPFALFAHE
jgi:cyclopropane fatty-acyl-phospholipid synthase-like methyltransferase